MRLFACSTALIALALSGCGGGGGTGSFFSAPLTKSVVFQRTGFNTMRPQGGSGGAMVGYAFDSENNVRAILWEGLDSAPVVMHPSSFNHSQLWAADQTTFVGDVQDSGGWKAAVWEGSNSSPTVLHPESGFTYTHAYGIKGSRVVGVGYENVTLQRALVWDGMNRSPRNLHNEEVFSETWATSTDGLNIVGGGWRGGSWGSSSAVIWKGPGLALTNLHPKDTLFRNTYANAVSGSLIVGEGQLLDALHAVAWRGTSASFMDIHPESGFASSGAADVQGNTIVGSGWIPGVGDRALLWNGMNNRPVDLHPLLAGHGKDFVSSQATDILENGDVVGHASTADGKTYPVLWTR